MKFDTRDEATMAIQQIADHLGSPRMFGNTTEDRWAMAKEWARTFGPEVVPMWTAAGCGCPHAARALSLRGFDPANDSLVSYDDETLSTATVLAGINVGRIPLDRVAIRKGGAA